MKDTLHMYSVSYTTHMMPVLVLSYLSLVHTTFKTLALIQNCIYGYVLVYASTDHPMMEYYPCSLPYLYMYTCATVFYVMLVGSTIQLVPLLSNLPTAQMYLLSCFLINSMMNVLSLFVPEHT